MDQWETHGFNEGGIDFESGETPAKNTGTHTELFFVETRAFDSKSASYNPRRISPMDAGHGIIAWMIIGIVAGWLTGKIMKGSGFGFFMDMVVGLIGAVVGGFAATRLGIAGPGQQGLLVSIMIAVVGAVLLTLVLRLVSGGRIREI
jgi:uncharacterized membrane protein YeaQ/YmgE (transglycosylase-associated protein family)